MIVKIKTFSGETLYLPEEDYLDEVMYSDLEEREFARKDYAGLTPEQANQLRARRNEAAQTLNKMRNYVDNESRALYSGNGIMSSEVKRRAYRNSGYGVAQRQAQNTAQRARQKIVSGTSLPLKGTSSWVGKGKSLADYAGKSGKTIRKFIK